MSGQAVLPSLTRTVLLTGRLAGPDLAGRTVLPDLAGLELPVRTVRIDEIGIGAAELALLEHHLASKILRRMELSHKTLVAQTHRLRNHQRHRGEAGAARAGPDGEAARALRQKTEPRAGAVVDLDLADPAVGIGIELEATLFGLLAAAPSGTSTRPVVPRMPSVAVGVVIFMSPVLATAAATKAAVPLATSKIAALLLPPSS